MSITVKTKTYPHITSNPKISEGEPLIEGTRITVRTIAGYYQMGMNVDEILSNLSHLKASQVHAALTYYFDHQDEVDNKIKENDNIDYWKSKVNR